MLQKGAKANSINEEGNTPLHIAMQGNQRLISSLLIANGGDMHANNRNGATPLMLAPGKLLQDLGLAHIPLRKENKKTIFNL